MLGGTEEFCGVSSSIEASILSKRFSNERTNAFTAGVIWASNSGGILLMRVLGPKMPRRFQIDFGKPSNQSVNG
ncbi:MAG: hypothetical protein D6753_13465 [Planctomycetota bacterium]|nr:MAG: hypothetical protein D6753_13465 [Planctomycetota bacterium]